jgi:hypothetical protein
MFSRFFVREDHIFRRTATLAAIRGVKVPICASNIVAGEVAKRSRHSINGGRAAFEFKEVADRSFVQIKMQAGHAKARPIFLIAERRAEADSSQEPPHASRVTDDNFPFEPLLVPRYPSRRPASDRRHECL